MGEECDKSLPCKQEFSEWYNDILSVAEIMDVRYPVKGLYVWFPFGFSIRKRVYNMLRELLDTDHDEALFPLLIPEHEFMKEAEHIKGFEDEVYWVTNGGTTPLDINLALRPTSETAIYPMYKIWIRSHADLPIKVYQIVNTFRYETKHTRPLIRLREITSFKEAHTVHANWNEAANQVKKAIELYIEFYKNLAIPVLSSKRPDWDKFPGADYTIAVDSLMPDGRTLQVGTAHHLGDNFAKTFDIKYENKEGDQVYAHQTCYGISERCIASLISVHGDDKGLVLPPSIAPVQIVIIPIIFKDSSEVLEVCEKVKERLHGIGLRVELDSSDKRPGAKYYKWELKGVPLRIEIGPRDLKNNSVVIVKRNDSTKEIVHMSKLEETVQRLLDQVHQNLYSKAEEDLYSKIYKCADIESVDKHIQKGIVLIPWCGNKECGLELEERTGAGILGIPQNDESCDASKCTICQKETNINAYMARTY